MGSMCQIQASVGEIFKLKKKLSNLTKENQLKRTDLGYYSTG